MISTVVFITESPFTERDFSRFGISILNHTFEVLILDCTSMLKPHFWEKYKEGIFNCSGYHIINDIEKLLLHIEKIKNNSIAIDLLGRNFKACRIRMILQEFGIDRVILQTGLLPKENDLVVKNFGVNLRNDSISFFKKFVGYTIRCIAPSQLPQIALCSGQAGLNDPRLVGVNHKVFGHSWDYDLYLANQDQSESKPCPYAVFLDEDMVYHSDYEHASLKPPATEGPYYSSMTRFFNEFERVAGIPIKVAAHPRSRYDLRPELWGMRSLEYGNTAQLVRDASIVLCHQSTSVSFAVLWKKPLIYLTTNEIDSSFLGPRIPLCSRLLEAPLINVDNFNVIPSIESLTMISEAAYAKYKEQYLKLPNTPEIPLWDIFTQYIKREL
jgi:hypothetical protein